MNVPLWVSPIIEIPGTAFLSLVLYFLLRQIHRRRAEFSSGFYVIFSWYCGYILFQILFNYFTARFDMYGWFPGFYLHNHVLARACILLLTFTAAYLPWAVTLLAANRFLAIVLPKVYNSTTWSRRGLWFAIVFNHLSSLLGLLMKTPVDADYVYVDERNSTLDLFIARDSSSIYWMGVIMTVNTWVGLAQTVVTLLLELAVIVGIFRYRSQGMLSNTQRNELRLAVFTLLDFVMQLFFLVCNYIQYVWASPTSATVSIVRAVNYWNFDVQSLVPCIALFCISNHFRNEFLRFYGLRSLETTKVTSHT